MRPHASLAALATLLLVACQHDRDDQPGATGCEIDYAAMKRAEMVELASAGEVLGRMMLGDLDEDDLTEWQVQSLERMQEILDDRQRPVDAADLAILERARAILGSPAAWDRADDRECLPDDTTFSLHCALFVASVEVTGIYEHRRTVMQEVRFAVEDAGTGRSTGSWLMDFNNRPETTFGDIEAVLARVRDVVTARLALQADCAL